MNKLLILAAMLMTTYLSAQNRYFVYFENKNSLDYPYSLDRPEEFLSQRALARRELAGISLDSTDLPVNPSYTSQLNKSGADVFFTSRWLNGAIVQTTGSIAVSLEQLDFVDSVAHIADDKKLVAEPVTVEYPTSFKASAILSGSTSDIQLLTLGADLMHADSLLGQGVRIAVFDNGYRGVNEYSAFQHLWQDSLIIATRDFVGNSGNIFQYGEHGTSVFSIIGAKHEDESGVYHGIAHLAEFVLCVTEENGSEDRVEEFNWLVAAEYADSIGVDIINSSLGYRTFDISTHNYDYEDLDGQSSIISKAAYTAGIKGIIVVSSAGNEGNNSQNSWRYITPPADASGILAVGSVDTEWERSGFSSIGPTYDGRVKPDVAAFGDATAVVRDDGKVNRGSGTSFAAPLIAGFAAGVKQLNPDWTSREVIAAIKNSSHRAYAADNEVGHGVPNFAYLVDGKTVNATDVIGDKIFLYPNPIEGDYLNISSESKLTKVEVAIYDEKGRLITQETIKKLTPNKPYLLMIKDMESGLYFLTLQTKDIKKAVKLINF